MAEQRQQQQYSVYNHVSNFATTNSPINTSITNELRQNPDKTSNARKTTHYELDEPRASDDESSNATTNETENNNNSFVVEENDEETSSENSAAVGGGGDAGSPALTEQQKEENDQKLLQTLTQTLTNEIHNFDKSIQTGRKWTERLEHKRLYPKIRPCKAIDFERREIQQYWHDSGLCAFVRHILSSVVKRANGGTLPANPCAYVEQHVIRTVSHTPEDGETPRPTVACNTSGNMQLVQFESELQQTLCRLSDENDALRLRIRAALNKLRSTSSTQTGGQNGGVNPKTATLELRVKDPILDTVEQFVFDSPSPVLTESDLEKFLQAKLSPAPPPPPHNARAHAAHHPSGINIVNSSLHATVAAKAAGAAATGQLKPNQSAINTASNNAKVGKPNEISEILPAVTTVVPVPAAAVETTVKTGTKSKKK